MDHRAGEEWAVLEELIRALLVAVLVGVAPGWCWAAYLAGTRSLAERLTYAIAFSIGGRVTVAVTRRNTIHIECIMSASGKRLLMSSSKRP